jgi:predicted negative regulator of RcsB-dependent stress response
MKQMESNEAKASLVLSAIMPVMDSGDFQKAVDGEKTMPGLKEIVSKYGNTPSGNMARLFLASAYYSLNKPDAALAMYGSFSNKNKDLEAAALAGTGACHTQLKQFATAADDYQNASAENETLKGQYLNKSADNRLLAGDSVKAKAVYNDVIKQFAGTSAAAVAQRSLWRLEGSETATNH